MPGSSFAEKSQLTTWVYAVARNFCIRFKQRVYDKNPIPVDFSMHPIAADEQGNVESSVLMDELKESVALYVQKLPGHLKHPLIYFYYENLKYKEIARIMQIPEGTVKSRINAAKTKLQQQLRRYVA